MANIVSTSETKIYQIKKWLGLNESPDGDTHMKMGEAAEMRNFRITAENHLQIRPGYGLLAELSSGNPVRGMWSGYIAGKHHVLAACGGHLWDLDLEERTAADKGAIHDSQTSMFGFSDKLYILTGGIHTHCHYCGPAHWRRHASGADESADREEEGGVFPGWRGQGVPAP